MAYESLIYKYVYSVGEPAKGTRSTKRIVKIVWGCMVGRGRGNGGCYTMHKGCLLSSSNRVAATSVANFFTNFLHILSILIHYAHIATRILAIKITQSIKLS